MTAPSHVESLEAITTALAPEEKERSASDIFLDGLLWHVCKLKDEVRELSARLDLMRADD
jgi:hypothetical protein